jgi:hypothetical protein
LFASAVFPARSSSSTLHQLRLPFLLFLFTGDTAEEISARKVQHSWGSWLKQDGSDASEQTGGGCEQQEADDDEGEEAGCCGHKHHHAQQDGADADSGKQEQVRAMSSYESPVLFGFMCLCCGASCTGWDGC